MPSSSHAVDCVYCAGQGCSECDGTGERYTHLIEEGTTHAIVHGSAPLSPESEKAIRAVLRAATALMEEDA